MAHCGYEPSAVLATMGSLRETIRAARGNLSPLAGLAAAKAEPRVPRLCYRRGTRVRFPLPSPSARPLVMKNGRLSFRQQARDLTAERLQPPDLEAADSVPADE